MTCQTTERGIPCNAPATHEVEGRLIAKHVCCEIHAKLWNSKFMADKDNWVNVRLLHPMVGVGK